MDMHHSHVKRNPRYEDSGGNFAQKTLRTSAKTSSLMMSRVILNTASARMMKLSADITWKCSNGLKLVISVIVMMLGPLSSPSFGTGSRSEGVSRNCTL